MTTKAVSPEVFTRAEIEAARIALAPYVIETPVLDWRSAHVREKLGTETRVVLKLELFQVTGTFKPRGALNVMLGLEPAALQRGVTAVSAGNHAIAVAYAAQALGTSAKVVMYATANPIRVEAARRFGAEVLLAQEPAAAFEMAQDIARREGRAFIHPFEGRPTAIGTATLGVEFLRQAPDLDAVIVPIGGGGLAAGVAAAVKSIAPKCVVYGVEPENADTMSRSFETGEPASAVPGRRSIADSLAPPYALPYSYGVCRQYLDGIVRVSDDALRDAMRLLFSEAKLAVEPAGAATAAALLGPLSETVRGRRVGLIVCGTNIDFAGYAALMNR